MTEEEEMRIDALYQAEDIYEKFRRENPSEEFRYKDCQSLAESILKLADDIYHSMKNHTERSDHLSVAKGFSSRKSFHSICIFSDRSSR